MVVEASSTPSPTPMCTDTSTWVDVDSVTCGDCTVLASLSNYDSCNAYCDAQSLNCAGAWEEKSENCVIKATYTCADNIHEELGTSDGLCQCIDFDDDDDDDDGSITSVLLDTVQGLYKVVKAFIYDTWNSYT
jgi:hypothetical protein